MIENPREKIDEIKKIWEQYRETENARQIYLNHLGDYFEMKVPSWGWGIFMGMIKDWKGIKPGDKKRKRLAELTDEAAEEIQETNRKRTILMLKDALDKYERNPNFFQNLSVKEVSMLYKIVQAAEEATKRTKIARGKLGLEAARTFFLPYQRMKPEELKLLKEQLDASFERLLQLRAGESAE